jgi:hypothetical protein
MRPWLVLAAVAACAHSPHPARGLSRAEFLSLMDELASAWNAGNARRAADCFAEDARYSSPPQPRVRVGRAALYEWFGGAAGRPRPMHMQWHHLVFDEEEQVGAGEYTFTYEVRTHGIVIVRIAGGRIANWRESEHASPLEWDELVGGNRF